MGLESYYSLNYPTPNDFSNGLISAAKKLNVHDFMESHNETLDE